MTGDIENRHREELILRSKGFILGASLLLAVSLYRPLVMWADNAWDLSSPERLLGFGVVVFLASLVPYLLLIKSGLTPLSSGFGLAGILHVAFNWHQLQPHPLVWLGVFVVVAAASQTWLRGEASTWIGVVAVAMLAVAPLVQVLVTHIQKQEPYPILERRSDLDGDITGTVEDVVVVIVDSYPSLQVASTWFDHDTDALRSSLDRMGFTSPEVGWSQHTFTGLAVPALLELGPVVEPGPKGRWGNRVSLYQITRGDNLVARTLRSAGYAYTHIESGWDGGSCGPVDTCLSSPWLDETMWELLRPSVISKYLTNRYGYHTVGSSLRVVENLESMASRFDDGNPDFVFAHLLLPHSPLVVDETCDVAIGESVGSGEFAPGSDSAELSLERLRDQLSCVDSLILRIAELAGPHTALIITGDHGTATRGQLTLPPEEWSDSDVAERLGVFLAYKLPETCAEPESNVNTHVMRAILACALDGEIPADDEQFLLGADTPISIAAQEVERIERLLLAGELQN